MMVSSINNKSVRLEESLDKTENDDGCLLITIFRENRGKVIREFIKKSCSLKG